MRRCMAPGKLRFDHWQVENQISKEVELGRLTSFIVECSMSFK